MNEWIKTNEKKPLSQYGEGANVLTVDSLGVMRVAYWDGGNWCWPTGECIGTTGKFPVTHWMPLPPPPKEEA